MFTHIIEEILPITNRQRIETKSRIFENAAPSPSYFILTILSTLIAAYGLVSNSTATVIGAMIVAPLMGPILGIALSTVRVNNHEFFKAATAEAAGVGLVIITGASVAWMLGAENIDFTQSEIINRTAPTLIDLAIGFFAGLAGAYCSVHPKLAASVAGVAIAVALVPPLAVTGITLMGALNSMVEWQQVFGSFMLFLANFLTIELASILVFVLAGFGHLEDFWNNKEFRHKIIIQLCVLALTSVFLTLQLTKILQERNVRNTSQETFSEHLSHIPGAHLDSLQVKRNKGNYDIQAVISSRNELSTDIVSEVQNDLREQLEEPELNVIVQEIRSTYVNAEGYLYEPPSPTKNPEFERQQLLDKAIKKALESYPGSTLQYFQTANAKQPGGSPSVLMTVNTPYAFGPPEVKKLQAQVNANLNDLGPVALVVRSTPVAVSTADGSMEYKVPNDIDPETEKRNQTKQKIQTTIRDIISTSVEGNILSVLVTDEQPTEGEEEPLYNLRVTVQTATPLSSDYLQRWKKMAQAQTQVKRLHLEIDNPLGVSYSSHQQVADFDPIYLQIKSFFYLVHEKHPHVQFEQVHNFTVVHDGELVEVWATVDLWSPEPVSTKSLTSWKKELQNVLHNVVLEPGHKLKLHLEVRNRLGVLRKL